MAEGAFRPAHTADPVLELELPVTRRRRVHILRDPSGEPIRADMSLADMIQFIVEQGYSRVEIETGSARYVACFGRLSPATQKREVEHHG